MALDALSNYLPYVFDSSANKRGWLYTTYYDTQVFQFIMVLIYTDGTMGTVSNINQITVLA